MGTKAVFASDGIFEEESFKRCESKGHVAAEEDKETDAG